MLVAAFTAVAVLAGSDLASVGHAGPVLPTIRNAAAEVHLPPGVSGTTEMAGRWREPARFGRAPDGAVKAAGVRAEPGQDAELFWAWDFHLRRYYQLRATNVYRSAAAWIYVEANQVVPRSSTDTLGRLFDDSIYPTLRAQYGRDPHPGIDDDPAITLLLLDVRDPMFHGAAPYTYYTGYFDPTNEQRQIDLARTTWGARSNEREMLYLDVAPTASAGRAIAQNTAHEFAHLIQWGYDANESPWLTEGLADLAVTLCGLGEPEEHLRAFLGAPGRPLTEWQGDPADYGRSYAFLLYLYEQAVPGDEGWLRRLVRNPDNSLRSISTTFVDARPLPEVFRDYALALYLDWPGEEGHHHFRALTLADGGGAGAYPFPAAGNRWADGFRDAGALGPWSVGAFSLDAPRAAVGLEVEGSYGLCLGAGWRDPAAGPPATACATHGLPAMAEAARADGQEPPLIVVVANGSDAASAFRVAAVDAFRTQSAARRVYLPFGWRD